VFCKALQQAPEYLSVNTYYIQGVSEIRVLILTSERTRQFIKRLYNILQNSQKYYFALFCLIYLQLKHSSLISGVF
jgi:hypothetical protein